MIGNTKTRPRTQNILNTLVAMTCANVRIAALFRPSTRTPYGAGSSVTIGNRRPEGARAIREGEKMNQRQQTLDGMDVLQFPFTTKVAGISRHQKALENVFRTTFFILYREPDNPHDSNAIAVKAWGKYPLGYVPRYVAESLAPLLDAGKVSRKATFVRKNVSEKSPDLPVGLTIKIHAKGSDK